MYAKYMKRLLDILLSGMGLIILSPVFVILTLAGAIAMGGNPFFTQLRPGKIDPKTGKERIFKLVKFRSMNNKKDKDGNFLPDDVRLSKYGRILRSTSLDELPELWNIFRGDMSIVGPRPLLVEYLPYYTEQERHRHDVRPGLTGWAQVNGRNSVDWDKRFQYDVYYIENISFVFDLKVIVKTVEAVFNRKGIHANTQLTEGNLAKIRAGTTENSGEHIL